MKNKIKELRSIHLKMTQESFADSLRVSANYIYMLEKGDRKPSKKLIDDICSSFNVNKEWMYGSDVPVFSEQADISKASIWLNAAIASCDDTFEKRFLMALSSLTPDQWEMVEEFMKKICGEGTSLPHE